MALACYVRAMDHVGVMAADEGFNWVDRVVLDLHFDACYFQKDKDPGQYRETGIEVTSRRRTARVYRSPCRRGSPADERDDPTVGAGDLDPPRGPCGDGASTPRRRCIHFGTAMGASRGSSSRSCSLSAAYSRQSSFRSRSTWGSTPPSTTQRCGKSSAAPTSRSAMRCPSCASAWRRIWLRRGDDCSNWTRPPSGGATSRVSSRSAAGPIGSSSRSSRPLREHRPVHVLSRGRCFGADGQQRSAPTARRRADHAAGRGPTTRYLASERLADAVRRRLETFDSTHLRGGFLRPQQRPEVADRPEVPAACRG